jgi:hypothetical protein
MVRRILAKSGRPAAAAERAVGAEHARRVAAVDAQFGLPVGTAAQVDAMHATPVMRHTFATARFLALDLFAAGGAVVLAALAILIWYPARIGLLGLVAAIAALGLTLYVGALRFRRITEAAELHRTAERLAQLFKVPIVIFGHSHAAGDWPLAAGGHYINVGTWVPEGEDAYFVYFAVTGDGPSRQSGLWRWNKRECQPQPFAGEAAVVASPAADAPTGMTGT